MATNVKEPKEKNLWILGNKGRPVPILDENEWQLWMEKHGPALRCLIKPWPKLSIGIRYVGIEQGLTKNFSPQVWQLVVFLDKRPVISTYTDSLKRISEVLSVEKDKFMQMFGGKKKKKRKWFLRIRQHIFLFILSYMITRKIEAMENKLNNLE